MCGICGTIGISGTADAGRAIRLMNAAMVHRGPDDVGELIGPPAAPTVALGMRRLSIIDLSGGHQPVFNETNDIAVVLNGEIYNFHALRQELQRSGHVFRSNSDTEAIVHAYEQWGESCLNRFRGMFAIAVLDMRSSLPDGAKVLLARDRLGIKPLYYAVVNGTVVFASEVRALLASEVVARRLSPDALDSYLLFGSVSEPMTLVEGVFSLPPGYLLSLNAAAESRDIRPRPYWTFGAAHPTDDATGRVTLESAAQRLRPKLEEAVNCHLIADVPIGIFLSSGLDSTALVALASQTHSGLNTFTVVFNEQDFSEAELSRATARRFGTKHEEVLVRGTQMLDRLDEAVSALDQPSMDGINTYFVSWAASRAGLKAALSGLGGDEIFGGYSTFQRMRRLQRVASISRNLPRSLRVITARALGRVGSSGDAARKIASLWSDGDILPHPYFYMRALFTPEQALALRNGRARMNAAVPWREWLSDSTDQAGTLDMFAAVSCLEARSYMAQTLLRDTDSVSMANSLEVRVPLLDHVLLEFVTQLPQRAKLRRGVGKALLVEALRDLLPAGVVGQRKRTFTLPWEHWLRGPLAQRLRAGLLNLAPALAPHMDAEQVKAVWPAFQSGDTSWSRPWSLYVLNEWCRRHLAAPSSSIQFSTAAASVEPLGHGS